MRILTKTSSWSRTMEPSPPLTYETNSSIGAASGAKVLSSTMAAASALRCRTCVCPAARWQLMKQTEVSSTTNREMIPPYTTPAQQPTDMTKRS